MPVTSADRSAELNRLIVEQGRATQSMRYGWRPTTEEQQVVNDRGARMHELAELLNLGGRDGVGKYLNDRIAAWLEANPQALTSQEVYKLIDSFRSPNPDTEVITGVHIQIGDPVRHGYHYRALRDDLVYNGQLTFKIPDSVAEYFRQQGRRQLQSEMRELLNVSRA